METKFKNMNGYPLLTILGILLLVNFSDSYAEPYFGNQTIGDGTTNFNTLSSVAVDSSGNIYVLDQNNAISKLIKFDSTFSLVTSFGGGDGDIDNLNDPQRVAIDRAGNIYITNGTGTGNTLLKFDSSGTLISSFGTSGKVTAPNSGTFFAVEVDGQGNIYVSDNAGSDARILKYFSTGTRDISFGNGDGDIDHTGGVIQGIAIDNQGNLYAADDGIARIFKYNTLGSNGTVPSAIQKENTSNRFDAGSGLATDNGLSITVDNAGNLYVLDNTNQELTIFNKDLSSSRIVDNHDAPLTSSFDTPVDLDISVNGTLYYVDSSSSEVLISLERFLMKDTTFGTNGMLTGIHAGSSMFDIVGISGNNTGFYVGDDSNFGETRILRFFLNGTLDTTFATDGELDLSAANVCAITSSSSGELFVYDCDPAIRKYTPSGTVDTTWSGDGILSETEPTPNLDSPEGMVVDSSGNLYFSDVNTSKYKMRKFSSAGVEDNTWPLRANGTFSSFGGIAIDSSGSLYYADSGNQNITKFTSAGILDTTFNGTGSIGSDVAGDLFGHFKKLFGIAVDSIGNLFVSDGTFAGIAMFDATTGNHTLSTDRVDKADDDDVGFSTKKAYLWVDDDDNLYMADQTAGAGSSTGDRIVRWNQTSTPGYPTSVSATAGDGQVVLTWTAPTNTGRLSLLDYIVEYRSGSNIFQVFNDTFTSTTGATVSGLSSNTSYDFKISTINHLGTNTTGISSATPTGSQTTIDISTTTATFSSSVSIINMPSNSTNLTIITVPTGTSSTLSLDFPASRVNSTGAVIIDSALTIDGDNDVVFTKGTVIDGANDWDGVLAMPTITTVSVSGVTTGVAIQFGDIDGRLTFSEPVKITLTGESGKLAYITEFDNTQGEIITTCNSGTTPTNIPTSFPQACKIDSGSDLVIFTKTASTFSSGTSSSSGSSGGGGSGGGDRTAPLIGDILFLGDGIIDSTESKYMLQVGQSISFTFNIKENQGTGNLEHITLYVDTKKPDLSQDFKTTHIRWEGWNKPVSVNDPNEIFNSANIEVTPIDAVNSKVDINFAFAIPIDDVYLQLIAWDFSRNQIQEYYPSVLQVVNAESLVFETPESKTKPSNEFGMDSEPIFSWQIFNEWAGYSSDVVSDQEFLSDLGIGGEYMPDWLKNNYAKWLKDGSITQQDFVVAIKYLHEKNIIN